ncbi:alpha/beta-hydrolase [Thozetella sp. PMI_491]|nr:alpha/beta-hydrolase [Thozetella sp. PMI_491]
METLLQQKTFTTSRSYTYNYYTTKQGDGLEKTSDTTLLLLHGWPMSAELWLSVLPSLTQLPCRIIVPDLLGYAGTSKPTDPSEYNGKLMAQDIGELLDSEKVAKIVPIGHDFGSWLAQRVYLYNPARCLGLIILSVAYMPPILMDLDFNLQTFLHITEAAAGYPRYDYFNFFVEEDAAEVVEQHLESLFTLIHGDSPTTIRDFYCNKGAFKQYLLEDRREQVKEHARAPGEMEKFVRRFKRDGFKGPFCWYLAITDAIQYRVEKETFKPEDIVIKDPVLFIGCEQDEVARTDAIEEPIKLGLLPDITQYELDCSHYCPLERPIEVGKFIVEFLEGRKLL